MLVFRNNRNSSPAPNSTLTDKYNDEKGATEPKTCGASGYANAQFTACEVCPEVSFVIIKLPVFVFNINKYQIRDVVIRQTQRNQAILDDWLEAEANKLTNTL